MIGFDHFSYLFDSHLLHWALILVFFLLKSIIIIKSAFNIILSVTLLLLQAALSEEGQCAWALLLFYAGLFFIIITSFSHSVIFPPVHPSALCLQLHNIGLHCLLHCRSFRCDHSPALKLHQLIIPNILPQILSHNKSSFMRRVSHTSSAPSTEFKV